MSFGTELPTTADAASLGGLDHAACGLVAHRAAIDAAVRGILEQIAAVSRHYSDFTSQATHAPKEYFSGKLAIVEGVESRCKVYRGQLQRAFDAVILPTLTMQQRTAFSKFIDAADSLVTWARTIHELCAEDDTTPFGRGTDAEFGMNVSESAATPAGTADRFVVDERPTFDRLRSFAGRLTMAENFEYNDRFRGNVLKSTHFAEVKRLISEIDSEYFRIREVQRTLGGPLLPPMAGRLTASHVLVVPPITHFAALRDSLQLLLATSQTEDELGAIMSFRSCVDAIREAADSLKARCATMPESPEERQPVFRELRHARSQAADLKSAVLLDIANRIAFADKFPTRGEQAARLAARGADPSRKPTGVVSWFLCCAEASTQPHRRETSALHEQKQQLLRMLATVQHDLDDLCDVCESRWPNEFSRDWTGSLKRFGRRLSNWAEQITVVVGPRQ